MSTLESSTSAAMSAADTSADQADESSPPPARRRRPAQWAVVITLIIGIVLSFSARYWALDLQAQAYRAGPYAAAEGAAASGPGVASAVGSLDSYILVLMLGGLRGPLVMYLWVSSENQKNERDLEDFNTKINLIRLLQPEFESVHSFQTWNKAFNVSVQIPNLPDRYAVILDAAEYARAADRGRPNSVNLLLMLNQVFQQKLGQTTGDSVYYRKRVREESKARPDDAAHMVGTFAQRMEPVLDEKFDVLERLVKPIQPRPATLDTIIHVPRARIDELVEAAKKADVALSAAQLVPSPGAREIIVHLPEAQAKTLSETFYPYDARYIWADWNDGSELQYLKTYEPYPYGVSPLALGFNYGKRAQVLVNRTKQRPTQLSTSVVDSRPGLELRDWAREERDRALQAEIRAYYPAQAAMSDAPLPQRFARWISRGPITPRATPYDPTPLLSVYLRNPNSTPTPRPISVSVDELALEKDALSRMSSIAPPADFGKTQAALDSIEEALYSFRQAVRLQRDGEAEYIRHATRSELNGIRQMSDFASHIDELTMEQLITEADYNFLMAQTPDQGRKHDPLPGYPRFVGAADLLKRAIQKYNEADVWSQYVNLKYYSPGELLPLALPPQESTNLVVDLTWKAAEVMRSATIAKHMSHPPLMESLLQPLTQPAPPTTIIEKIVWNAATQGKKLVLPLMGGMQAWRLLPPSAPRQTPEMLRDHPEQVLQAGEAMAAAIRWAPGIDQNASTRAENAPNLIRSALRRRAAMMQLAVLEGKPLSPRHTLPVAGDPTTLPASTPLIPPATAPAGFGPVVTPTSKPATAPATSSATSPATQPSSSTKP